MDLLMESQPIPSSRYRWRWTNRWHRSYWMDNQDCRSGRQGCYCRSDPGAYDTDRDGLSDAAEYYVYFTNATDSDTDSDGLEDFTEVIDGFYWNGSTYLPNASSHDTDLDGLADGESHRRIGPIHYTCKRCR